jgi:hypothetical protein
MPISVTCTCGARLEIDEKFLGKEVPCPDCGKPLPTKAPPAPPPLELPNNRRLSVLAILSLTVGLVLGLVPIIGPAIAIALGILAIGQIRNSKRLEGMNLARAGVAVGALGFVLGMVILLYPFGVDFVLRQMVYLKSLTYAANETIESRGGADLLIKRPKAGLWGSLGPDTQPGIRDPDDLIAVNINADAYIACQHAPLGLAPDDEAIQKAILEKLATSELVNMLGRLNGQPAPEPTVVTPLNALGEKANKKAGEMVVDMRLGGIDRRMLVTYRIHNAVRVYILVGCARKNQFEALEPEFRDAFSGYKNTR